MYDGIVGRSPMFSIAFQVGRDAGGRQEDVVPGKVGVDIAQSATVAGELVAVLQRESLVLDGDEILVVPVQDQDVQVAPLFVDFVPPLLEDLGGCSNPRRAALAEP